MSLLLFDFDFIFASLRFVSYSTSVTHRHHIGLTLVSRWPHAAFLASLTVTSDSFALGNQNLNLTAARPLGALMRGCVLEGYSGGSSAFGQPAVELGSLSLAWEATVGHKVGESTVSGNQISSWATSRLRGMLCLGGNSLGQAQKCWDP